MPNWVRLTNFQITDWYPRSPGLYHTERAESERQEANRYATEENGVKFYDPFGKVNMMKGGLGSLRFKSLEIEGEECWLSTATSDGYCHSGVPLAIPERLVSAVGFDSSKHYSLLGKIRFLPPFLEQYFRHNIKIPQLYVLVEKINVVAPDSEQVLITPMLLFKTSESDWEASNNVTYVTCRADDYDELDRATDWLEWYVGKYKGEICTNFDQQRPTFANVPFSLQNIMTHIDPAQLQERADLNPESLLAMVQEAISKGGITVDQSIHMSGDFRGAIVNVRSTLTSVSQNIDSIPMADLVTKDELKELVEQLSDILQNTPPEKVEEAEAIAESAKSLVDSATKEKPNKALVQIRGEELKAAAKNLAEVMPTVLIIATQIVTTIARFIGGGS